MTQTALTQKDRSTARVWTDILVMVSSAKVENVNSSSCCENRLTFASVVNVYDSWQVFNMALKTMTK